MTRIPCTLLVDDDDTANYLNEKLFSRLEVSDKLLVARNGREALSVINDNCQTSSCPALILLDINMPVMDGFEFLEAYKLLEFKNKQSVVIIMLTTSLNPRDVEKVQAANVAGLVNKPLTKKVLQEIIEQHFGTKPL